MGVIGGVTVGVTVGSAGGTDAVGGTGGTDPSGGTATGATGGVTNSGAAGVGSVCTGDSECSEGLVCVAATSDLLGGGGPARGVCTRRCGEEGALDHESCQSLAADSRCGIAPGGAAYCFPSCRAGAGGNRCGGRDDLACDPTTQVCGPKCASHADCPSARYCDPRSGVCIDDEPTGLSFDEPCDPTADVDPCRGYCSDEGVCVETCVIGTYPSCGSSSNTEATADCLFLLSEQREIGDLGACGRLCDCHAECLGDTSCVQITNSQGPFEYRGRTGICVIPTSADVPLPCGAAGAGGSP